MAAENSTVPAAWRFLAVLGALLGLLALSIALAYVDLGSYNLIVALAIATTKMLLVMLFFMQLVRGTAATRIAAGGGVFMLLILGALLMSDYLGREHFGARVLPVNSLEIPLGEAALPAPTAR